MDEKEALKELSGLKGIGESKAKLLLKAGFRSLEDLSGADEDRIAKVKGIGPNIAKKIKNQLGEIRPIRPLSIKPALSKADKEKIKQARESRRKKPDFKRQEFFRYKRLGDAWRRPKGHHSKLRLNKRYRPPSPSIGYRSARETRGLHPSGFKEVFISNPNQIASVDPAHEAIRISGRLGRKKRTLIADEAIKRRIRILNWRES
ncbi:MAG TPA: 50S ribosomal protein L32e [Thermoplasmata archaeon]|nr:50S ribosomal protein L32e [Thermoplasmata archaeon]